ncbi:MAG: CopD family protein [Alphaproteobacteria bacterium]|nr:CopD family protein [Alphaproteobacteria bacterium]
MILEFLQPGASLLDALVVLLRAGYHAAALGAVGLFLYGLWAPLPRRWIIICAGLGIALSLLGLPLRVLVLTGGESAWDGATWEAVLVSRIGDAAGLRVLGLVALMLAGSGRAGAALGGAGALLVAASYAAMGHSTLYRPRQELAALVTLHVLAVGFWVGSLGPLWLAAMRGDSALIARWSRLGAIAVALLAGSGGVLAVLLVRRTDLLFAGWYGYALVAKLVVVGAMLVLAARHRWVLGPALARGEAGAGARLARSIALEAALALLAFYAAAELVSVHPVDAGHRING